MTAATLRWSYETCRTEQALVPCRASAISSALVEHALSAPVLTCPNPLQLPAHRLHTSGIPN